MHLELRLAGDADRHAIQQLDGLARGGDVDRNVFIHEAVTNRRCLVAEDREVVGYVVTAPRHFFDRDFVELLMVHDNYQRHGVGRALLRAAVARAGTSRVFSSTNESNAAMRSLFTTDGWTLSGRLDGLDQNDRDRIPNRQDRTDLDTAGRIAAPLAREVGLGIIDREPIEVRGRPHDDDIELGVDQLGTKFSRGLADVLCHVREQVDVSGEPVHEPVLDQGSSTGKDEPSLGDQTGHDSHEVPLFWRQRHWAWTQGSHSSATAAVTRIWSQRRTSSAGWIQATTSDALPS